jgi:2-haloacid dehalogenase
MTRVIAFDVNETLLDLSALDDPFMEIFSSPAFRGQWFAQMLQLSFVGGLTGEYVDFSTAQHAALFMLALRHGVTLSENDAVGVVNRMNSLPAYPEVEDAKPDIVGADISEVVDRIVAIDAD